MWVVSVAEQQIEGQNGVKGGERLRYCSVRPLWSGGSL